MSALLNFLKGVLTLFISNFPAFIDRLFKKIPAKLSKEVQLIINVVNVIKLYVDSELADVITAAIPSDVDDKIKEWLRKALPVILKELNMVKDGKVILSVESDIKGAQLRSIASVLTQQYTNMPADQAAITSAVVYRATA